MNLLFTICARAGSKGVKNKNVRQFLNYPIVYYTLSAYQMFAEKYGSRFSVIDLSINTDSEELYSQVDKTSVKYNRILRRENLAGDFVSKTDVIKDTVLQTEALKNCTYDIIVDLDLTSPLRTVEDIKGAFDTLNQSSGADVVYSVSPSRRLPHFNMVAKDGEYYNTLIKTDFIARQEAPLCYDMNATIYVYRKSFLLDENTKKVHDGNALIWEMMDTGVLDIDNEGDLELMEVVGQYLIKKHEGLGVVYQNIGGLIRPNAEF